MDAIMVVSILDGEKVIKKLTAVYPVNPEIIQLIEDRPILAAEYLCNSATDKLIKQE